MKKKKSDSWVYTKIQLFHKLDTLKWVISNAHDTPAF